MATFKKYKTRKGMLWRYQVCITDPMTGQKRFKSKSGFATKRDAKIAADELEKLICFKLSDDRRSISRDDIELICSRTVSDRVFDMISAKLSGNISRALRLCEEMLSIKIPAGRILYMLERQFNSLYIMKDMSSLGMPDQEIMKAASLTDWQLRRLRKEARSISRDRAYDYLRLSVELETRIKQGDMPERIALELLLSS